MQRNINLLNRFCQENFTLFNQYLNSFIRSKTIRLEPWPEHKPNITGANMNKDVYLYWDFMSEMFVESNTCKPTGSP